MKTESRAICRLSLLHPSPAEAAETRRVFEAVRDWDLFERIAKANEILPWLTYQMKEQGLFDRLPAALRETFQAETDRVRGRNERRNEKAMPVLRDLAQAGVSFSIIKGVGLSETIYRNPNYKKSNDIDLFVHRRDIDAIYRAYAAHGFIPIAERVNHDEKKQRELTMHAAPFVSRDLSCVLGTQWGLKTFRYSFRLDYPGIWSRAHRTDFHGVPIQTLAPEDQIIHLSLHYGYFKTYLKDLMDLINLVRAYRTKIDWTFLHEESVRTGADNHVGYAFALIDWIDPHPESRALAEKLRPRLWRQYRRMLGKRLADPEAFLLSSVDYIQTIEKGVTFFFATDDVKEKTGAFLWTWKKTLFPKSRDLAKMTLARPGLSPSWLLERVRWPWTIFRALAEELGWSLVFLLFVKLFVDLFAAFLKAPFVPNSERNLAAYGKRIGIPEDELKKLQEHFS